jgi:predicted nucleotidyltransferase
MEKDQARQILETFNVRLLTEIGDHVRSIYWFGSTARAEAAADSDIDVLVLADSEDPAMREIAFDISAEVSLAFDCVLSVLFMSFARYAGMKKEGRLLARNIEKEGIILYGRG